MSECCGVCVCVCVVCVCVLAQLVRESSNRVCTSGPCRVAS